jgi:hypothetical protein
MAEEKSLQAQDEGSPEKSTQQERERELVKRLTGDRGKYVRFVLAALATMPWFGVLSAVAALGVEVEQEETNELLRLWLKTHSEKAQELEATLRETMDRLDGFGEQIDVRIQSPEYISLVRLTFRSWDEAETQDKRQMFKKLLANAAVSTTDFSRDDLIRLFISWVNQYHEAHFFVIKEIYKNPGIARGAIWDKINERERPREDSLDADLYKYLIRELSMGGVVRQEKETDEDGNFLKSRPQRRPKGSFASRIAESAFDDDKPYLLTELGKEFVHYVMEDVVPMIGAPGQRAKV